MEQNQEKPKISYETLWKFIIRPDRYVYDEKLLGKSCFHARGKTYVRKDYDLISSQGYTMKCSFFEPEELYRPKKIMPVVLYLHGNSSSRLEGINMLIELIKKDINLFVVDFPGCGLSEGEYISLGYHESHDVKIIVDFIEKIPGVGYIGIWGRSMGAATTMIYAHKDDRIKAICMDSPFADFSLLAKELVLKQIKLPGFLIDGALKIIRMTIKKKNGLDIEKLKPIDSAPKTTQPAMFIHANDDELINNKHSDLLMNAYKGKDKILKRCKGQHNTKRPFKLVRDVGDFFFKYLIENNHDNYNKKKETIKKNAEKTENIFDFLEKDTIDNSNDNKNTNNTEIKNKKEEKNNNEDKNNKKDQNNNKDENDNNKKEENKNEEVNQNKEKKVNENVKEEEKEKNETEKINKDIESIDDKITNCSIETDKNK